MENVYKEKPKAAPVAAAAAVASDWGCFTTAYECESPLSLPPVSSNRSSPASHSPASLGDSVGGDVSAHKLEQRMQPLPELKISGGDGGAKPPLPPAKLRYSHSLPSLLLSRQSSSSLLAEAKENMDLPLGSAPVLTLPELVKASKCKGLSKRSSGAACSPLITDAGLVMAGVEQLDRLLDIPRFRRGSSNETSEPQPISAIDGSGESQSIRKTAFILRSISSPEMANKTLV